MSLKSSHTDFELCKIDDDGQEIVVSIYPNAEIAYSELDIIRNSDLGSVYNVKPRVSV